MSALDNLPANLKNNHKVMELVQSLDRAKATSLLAKRQVSSPLNNAGSAIRSQLGAVSAGMLDRVFLRKPASLFASIFALGAGVALRSGAIIDIASGLFAGQSYTAGFQLADKMLSKQPQAQASAQ